MVITATIAFFPLLANTIMGLRAAPQDQVEMMISYTASRWQVFRMVRLLQALPYIFVGLDVAQGEGSLPGTVVDRVRSSEGTVQYIVELSPGVNWQCAAEASVERAVGEHVGMKVDGKHIHFFEAQQ